MLRNKKKGFTLVELIIVIAIIGILIAIAIPRFADATQGATNKRIESNCRSIASNVAQFYAENTKWPATTDHAAIIKAAGIKDDAPDKAQYKIEKADNQGVVVSYTEAANVSAYKGNLAKGNLDGSAAYTSTGTATAYFFF